MKKLNHSFKDEIRKGFLRYAILPIIVLLVLFTLFTYFQSEYILKKQTYHSGQSIKEKYEHVHHSYTSWISEVANQQEIIEFINYRINGEIVYEQFYDFNSQLPIKSILHIVDTEGKELASSSNSSSTDTDKALREITKRMARISTNTLNESNIIYYSFNRKTSYTYGKAIYDRGTIIGYILLQLYEEDLQQLLNVKSNEIAVLVDEHNYVIATTNNRVRGLLNKFNPNYDKQKHIILNDVQYFSVLTEIPNTKLKVYTLNSAQSQEDKFYLLGLFFIVASILLLVLVWFLSRKLASSQTVAIDMLIEAVNEIKKGDLDTRVHIKSHDEFETLAEHINEMSQSLKKLQIKNEELSELRRVSEMKLLQSQFHPHFIYNVLETLRYAIVLDKDAAQNIVIILSRLLRYSIQNSNDSVKFSDDLNYISDYLSLQKMRFESRLQYQIEVELLAQEALVPRLLLQTVIENSIKYGYRAKESITININCYISDEHLVIRIVDDSNGMSSARLEEVRAIMLQDNNQSGHTGLHNLNRRLKLMYGESFGIKLYSTEGVGTTAIITIPCHFEKEN